MATPFQQRILADLAEIGHPVDVTAGGTLQHGGTQLADIFRATAVKQGRGIMAARLFSSIARARHAWPFFAMHDTLALGAAFVREHHREQGDTDYLRGREPSRAKVVQGFASRMMQPGSGFANAQSMENFRRAMGMHAQGADITWEITPHTSEMDPVFAETIIRDAGRSWKFSLRQESERFLAENIIVIGHKVRLSTFHRIFAGAVNSLSIVAPKYREGLEPGESALLHAQSRVISDIMSGIHAHARMMLLRCPEGGRMRRDNRIGLFAAVEQPPAYMVPLHLDMPFNFIGVDEQAPEAHKPATVHLFCGEPYQVTGKGMNERATNRVLQLYDSLQAVGARVDRYSWGIKKVLRTSGPVDRATGAEEQYREIVPRRAM